MRLGTRIYFSAAMLAVVALVISLMGVLSLRSYRQVVMTMQTAAHNAVLAERVNGIVLAIVMDSRGIYMSEKPADAEKYAGPLLKNLDRLRQALHDWRDQMAAEKRTRFADAEAASENFIRFRSELVRLSRESSLPEARAFGDNDQNRSARAALNEQLKKLSADSEDEVSKMSAKIESEYTTQQGLFAVVLLIGLGAGFGFTYYVVSRMVVKPLHRLSATMSNLANGDFDADIPYLRSDGEIGEMAAAIGVFKNNGLENRQLHEQHETEQHQAHEHLRNEMLTLTEVLEGEIQQTVSDISTQAMRMTEGASKLSRVAADLHQSAEIVMESIDTTAGNVQTVASATTQLEASSREILTQISNSSNLAGIAKMRADEASGRVSSLTDATAQIGNVVGVIQSIAGQTRMLALNATIEAARAGEAGKGFKVVADEVKGLARQTESGISNVNAQTDNIARTTREAVDTVEAVTSAIHDMDAISHEVARAAEEQRSATEEIMASAAQAADHTASVSGHVKTMLRGVDVTRNTSARVNELANMVNRDISALERRLGIILRTSLGGDRRQEGRVAAAFRFVAQFGAKRLEGYTGDISRRGALLVFPGDDHMADGDGKVELDGIGIFDAQFLTDSAIGLHVRFTDLPEAKAAILEEAIAKAEKIDLTYATIVQEVAAKAVAAAENEIRQGGITQEDLFSIDYELIAGTNPAQFMAPHTNLADRLFRPLIEPPLQKDPRIVFCCITDRSGYIAAHNAKYSEPQRPDDPIWNAAHSRNRRIFDDRAGILAARNTKPLYSQTYPRDMGGGNFILLKELDAPITIAGQHWGAVRMALKLG